MTIPGPGPGPLSTALTAAELERRFTYHPPRPGQQRRYVDLRAMAHTFAQAIVELTPPSREQSLALTALEEAVMWANASIARREPEELPGG